MHFYFENVNHAFNKLVAGIHNKTIMFDSESSRNGPVIRIIDPVIVTYRNPRQRVLFNAARDCNPFFHLYESLWMLAGRNDVAPLAYFNSNIAKYSDDGRTFNGAYGYRWRQAPTVAPPSEAGMYPSYVGITGNQYWIDQLEKIISHLRTTPDSRRAVLQMWNVEEDLLNIDSSKDVCCNLSACFSLRELGHCRRNHSAPDCPCCELGHEPARALDMTVFNRSNDMVWGMLGANVVHFSMLQEYLANCLDVAVGVYHQVSNNLHVYQSNWHPEKWLADTSETDAVPTFYPAPFPRLVQSPKAFDVECRNLVDNAYRGDGLLFKIPFNEPFLELVAKPMCLAWQHYKTGNLSEAIDRARTVEGADWSRAAVEWLQRRLVKREAKSTAASRKADSDA